jgi:hypothetical protein
MNVSNKKMLVSRQEKRAKIPASPGVCLALILSLSVMGMGAKAINVTMELSGAETNISYIQDFSVLDTLSGTSLNGQSQSMNVFFSDNDFLVSAGYTSFTMDLFINESGAIGTWPTNQYCVTGYLIDAAGNPLSAPVSFPDSGTIPAQVWPGWPYYLPDGTEYLPPTKMFEARFAGTLIYGNPGGFYINPIIFSGVHFDITYPVSPTDNVIGGRVVIANFDEPILNSPNPVPVYAEYFESIPQPTLAVTGGSGPGSGGTGNTNGLYLQLVGTPNYPYILETATNLTNPVNWRTIMTNSADSNGNWNITITNSPGVPAEFFQVVAWPGPGQQ